MINRIAAPEYHPIENVALIHPQRSTLANGAELFVFDAGEQELIRIQWVFENAPFQPAQPILNAALSALMLEGTSRYSSAQIAEKIDFYGAYLFPEYSFDHTSLNLITLNKYLDQLLPFVMEVLNDLTFPQQEIDTYTRNSKQSLKISLQKNDYAARRAFNHALFGDSNYGYNSELSDFDHLNRAALLSTYKEYFVPANCTVFVAGKVSDASLRYIRKEIGEGWTATGGKPAIERPVFSPAEAKQELIEREKAIQSAIRIGQLSIQRSDPDFPALQVLNTVLGGYFGSRLMMNIREDKGYTYGVGSGVGSLKHAAFFTISSEVGTDVCADTLKEIEFELRRLREEPVSEEELALVKNYLLGSMLGSLEDVFSHADKFKQVYFSGLGLDYYDYYTREVQEISPSRLQALAREHLDYDKMVKVIVGKIK